MASNKSLAKKHMWPDLMICVKIKMDENLAVLRIDPKCHRARLHV